MIDGVLRYLRAHPFSAALGLLITLTAVVAGTLWGRHPAWLAASPESLAAGRWWTVLTALLVPDSLIELLLTLALIGTVLAYTERMLGSARCALLFLGTGLVGMLGGVAVQAVAESQGAVWARASGLVLDPAVGVVGAIMAGSALAPVLFRRRIRLLGFSVLLMFAVYGGDADSAFRLVAAGAGLGAGALLARGRTHAPWHRSSYGEVRALIGAIVAVTGLGPLIVILTGVGTGPLSPEVAGLRGTGVDAILARCADDLSDRCVAGIGFSLWGFLMSLVPVVLSLVAALGLVAGRRAAWVLAVVVNLLTGVLIVVSIGADDLRHPAEIVAIDRAFPGFAVVAVVVPVAMCAVLIITRRRFDVRVGRREAVRFTLVVLLTFVVLAAVSASIVVLSGGDTGYALLDALRRFLPTAFVHGRTAVRLGPAAGVIRHAAGPVFWAVFVAAMLRMLRAPAADTVADEGERYRGLLREGGDEGPADTMGFIGTWGGNRHWFTPDGRGAVAYRVISSIALVVGDPAGSGREATLRGFADFCDRRGWMPVLYGVHDETLVIARKLGWSHLPVGEETVVPLERFALQGSAWAKVRQPYRRGARDGLRAEWTRWQDLSPVLSARLEALSEQWIAEKALPEMGFTLGGIDELKDPDVALMLALGPDGELQAVTSWLPVWQRGEVTGWTLDFMRRADGAMPGVMEFVIASAALRMQDEGLRT
ncbi:MAG: DUF2156 domain-containing protein, partial [Microbacterium sp.]|nr:DUF2156 domain-containing protein [Microbacterium sp.]